jgi:hypothetical protein
MSAMISNLEQIILVRNLLLCATLQCIAMFNTAFLNTSFNFLNRGDNAKQNKQAISSKSEKRAKLCKQR